MFDVSQDGLLVSCESPVIGAFEFDDARPRDVGGEIPAGADANGAVTVPVEHQGRSANSTQKMSHVRVAQPL